MRRRTGFYAVAALVLATTFLAPGVLAAAKIGKIFVKAAPPDAGGFSDPKLEDSVKDLQRRIGDFELVTKEEDAEFLLVVVSREEVVVSGQPNSKRLTVTLSVREGDKWTPGIKIVKVNNTAFGLTALKAMGDAQKWVKDRAKGKGH